MSHAPPPPPSDDEWANLLEPAIELAMAAETDDTDWLDAASAYRPTARVLPDLRQQLAHPDAPHFAALGSLFSTESFEMARLGIDIVVNAINQADLYWVSPDLTELAEVAQRTMPDQPLLADDVPSVGGLMVFGSPVSDEDADGFAPINAYSWALWDKAFYERCGAREDMPEMLTIVGYMWTGEYGLVSVSADKWPLDQPPGDSQLRRRLAAILTLCQQERTVEIDEVAPDRASRRRTARNGGKVSTVKVVDLRGPKRSGSGQGHTTHDVEWTHRWVVSGHWRNQWLPSRQVHRLQWIHPHVKGPDDKPLVVKETVRVVR